jgi:MSHA pilin protein MshC
MGTKSFDSRAVTRPLGTAAPRAVAGFTLIELIVVIVLMAILIGVASTRFFGQGAFEAPAFAQELASAARYAQKLAVVSGCPVSLAVTATGYALLQPATSACSGTPAMTRPVQHPASGEDFVATVPGGVAIGGAATVTFSGGGIPSTGATYTIGGQQVIIAAGSGYVDVQ